MTLEAAGSPEGSYPATIAASTAASLGADLTLWFRPWFGARVDFLYAPSNFELRLAEEDRVDVLGEDADYRGLDYADLSLFSLHAAGVVALPIPSRHLAPYALVGAGATLLRADHRARDGLQDAFDGRGSSISFSGTAGLGVKIPLRGGNAGRVALSFELVDRITRTPIDADDGRELLLNDELRVVNLLHDADQESDARYVHGVGIMAGLTFATGGPTPVER